MEKEGNITVFLALVLTLVLSFLFSLLEAARVQGLRPLSERDLQLRLGSALGAYNVPLWQDYRLLFLDGGEESGTFSLAWLEGAAMEEAALEKAGEGFFRMALRNFEITEYGLAADHDGAAFRAQACRAIKEQLASGAAKALREKLSEGKSLADGEAAMKSQWDAAQDATKKAEEAAKEEAAKAKEDGEPAQPEGGKEGKDPKELPPNPMEEVDLLKRSSILYTVVEDPSGISGKSIPLQEKMASRKREAGTMEEPEGSALGKWWFLQYLDYYFSCHTGAGQGGSAGHALDYELEYCIGGKASDRENLEKTVKELLLLREAGNFATIMQDTGKQAVALEIAAAAVGFTGIAPLVQAVKIGILMAWSYIESIQDVRILLKGGSVPLIKKPSEWKSDISVGTRALEKKAEKEEAERGFSYREYLLILLLLKSEKTLAYRAMDVIEQNIRLLPGKEKFRMDFQAYKIRAAGLYTAQPMFLSFVSAGHKVDGAYGFAAEREASYL